MVRKKRNHEFLVFRLLLHAPKRNLFVGVEIEGVDEKLALVEGYAERFMESFALVDPKTVKVLAAPKGRPAPKRRGGAK
jgi:hypothetical protein